MNNLTPTQAQLDMIMLRLIRLFFDEIYYMLFVSKIVEMSDGGETPLFARENFTRSDELWVDFGYADGRFCMLIIISA